ncbi:MAG: cobyrinate a,c-diamide synthase [Magnetococcus sp. MYC-9]
MANFPGIFVGATRKSSGKTLISIGLLESFVRRGLVVQPFKKGPDYIDPRWLAAAAGRACHNLDFFMMGQEAILNNFFRYAQGADLSLVEGNMGLFDGQDLQGADCGAALADLLQLPILLVIDCQGLARGIAPLVRGHLDFPGGEAIRGLILNNISSPRQERKILAALQHYCPVPILGTLPRDKQIVIEERHLGLEPAGERDGLQERLRAIGNLVAEHLDLERILQMARQAPARPPPPPCPARNNPPVVSTDGVRVAYVTDRAFHFYYPENLLALQEQGVELVPVSLLGHESLPEVSGLYIGGGFPEMFMDDLAANQRLMGDLRQKIAAGLPVYAECGGLMVLAEKLHWQGHTVPMVGALPIEVSMGRRPQGYGYMEVEGCREGLWPGLGQRVPCHEFHYSGVTRIGEGVTFAYRVLRGHGVDGRHDGLLFRKVFASYAHIHADGAPGWGRFLAGFWRK